MLVGNGRWEDALYRSWLAKPAAAGPLATPSRRLPLEASVAASIGAPRDLSDALVCAHSREPAAKAGPPPHRRRARLLVFQPGRAGGDYGARWTAADRCRPGRRQDDRARRPHRPPGA